MQFTLLMVAASHCDGWRYLSRICRWPALYEKHPGESVSPANAVTQLGVLANVYRFFTGERHHVCGGRLAASPSVDGRASDLG